MQLHEHVETQVSDHNIACASTFTRARQVPVKSSGTGAAAIDFT
jgi:hypothetical protein